MRKKEPEAREGRRRGRGMGEKHQYLSGYRYEYLPEVPG